MARKTWSNLFLALAAGNLGFALVPHNPLLAVNWSLVAICVGCAALARRKMIAPTERREAWMISREMQGREAQASI